MVQSDLHQNLVTELVEVQRTPVFGDLLFLVIDMCEEAATR
jgi:hypothetical protein